MNRPVRQSCKVAAVVTAALAFGVSEARAQGFGYRVGVYDGPYPPYTGGHASGYVGGYPGSNNLGYNGYKSGYAGAYGVGYFGTWGHGYGGGCGAGYPAGWPYYLQYSSPAWRQGYRHGDAERYGAVGPVAGYEYPAGSSPTLFIEEARAGTTAADSRIR